MREATRQMVLLIGVMTILTTALITINTARSEDPIGSKDSQNMEEPKNNSNSSSNSSNIISKSINGWKQLWKDMQAGQEAALGSKN